jgi:hypothetical protein
MITEKQIAKVRSVVRKYMEEHGSEETSEARRDHIIETGTSILCTKWDIGHQGGSFVQAVVANDLSKAFGCADYINEKALKFYCQLIQNVGMIDVTDDEVKGAF